MLCQLVYAPKRAAALLVAAAPLHHTNRACLCAFRRLNAETMVRAVKVPNTGMHRIGSEAIRKVWSCILSQSDAVRFRRNRVQGVQQPYMIASGAGQLPYWFCCDLTSAQSALRRCQGFRWRVQQPHLVCDSSRLFQHRTCPTLYGVASENSV